MPTIKHFVNFRDRPIIYARIPKVANSSIKAALTRLLVNRPEGRSKVTSDGFWRNMTGGQTEMLSARLAWRQRKEKLIFSFVRNPLDRLVSCYNNKILNEASFTPQMAENGYRVGMSFPDFVRRTSELPDEELDVHMASQSHMLMHNGLVVPSFVGHFEDMDFQWFMLRKKLLNRFEIVLPGLPKKNVRREDRDDMARHFADDAVLELAVTKFARDIEIFYPGVEPDRLVSGDFITPEIARPTREKPAADEAAPAEVAGKAPSED